MNGIVLCPRCGGEGRTVQSGGDGYIRHTAACLRETARVYREWAANGAYGRRANMHDSPAYLRMAAEHDAAAVALEEAGARR